MRNKIFYKMNINFKTREEMIFNLQKSKSKIT